MASIFRKHRSPYYFAAYRGAKGERIQRTTKQRNRTEALRMAQAWEKLAEKGRAGVLTETQTRRVLAEILESATGETIQFYTCRAWLDEWLAGKAGTVAASTLERYKQVNTDFLAHLGERAELTVAAIGPKDVRSFRDSLAKGGRAPATVNLVIRKVLTAPFAAAVRLGYIPMNPCASVEPLRDETDAARGTFTAKQVRSLIEAADDEWKGAILLGYFTGLRLKDIAELEWAAVDLEAAMLRLRTGKTGLKLEIPIHPELVTWLKSRPRGIAKAPVLPALAGMGTGGRYGLSGRFIAIMERAKVIAPIVRTGKGAGRQTRSLSFHSLRHSFVSALANAGVPAELRQRLSGHADEQSHARYTHHEAEVLRAAVEKLPGVGA